MSLELGAGPAPSLIALLTLDEREVDRQLHICNACRYCEGFCAVFPAMTRRLEFIQADVHYLANLCHNCGACLHACQYAPPHDFAVNLPQALARGRGQTYAHYAWPAACGLGLFLILALALRGTLFPGPLAGDFYAIFPHGLLAGLFGGVFGLALLALGLGIARFWRGIGPPSATGDPMAHLAAGSEALDAALRLKYLGGGHGQGCNEDSDRFTLWRRRCHHLTCYGFLLCFAATLVATGYHYLLAWEAPYPLFSAPVLLGTLGGLGLVVGPTGLLWLSLRRDPRQRPMDRGFILLLLLVSLSGLALLAGRDGHAMALLLALHLGSVLALFLTLPYGKFAHGLFRSAALLKYAQERRQPDRLRLGGD